MNFVHDRGPSHYSGISMIKGLSQNYFTLPYHPHFYESQAFWGLITLNLKSGIDRSEIGIKQTRVLALQTD